MDGKSNGKANHHSHLYHHTSTDPGNTGRNHRLHAHSSLLPTTMDNVLPMKLKDKILTAITVVLMIAILIWSIIPVLIISPIIAGIGYYYIRKQLPRGQSDAPYHYTRRNHTRP